MTENALIGRGDRNARKDDEPRVLPWDSGARCQDQGSWIRGNEQRALGDDRVRRRVRGHGEGALLRSVAHLPCEREEAY